MKMKKLVNVLLLTTTVLACGVTTTISADDAKTVSTQSSTLNDVRGASSTTDNGNSEKSTDQMEFDGAVALTRLYNPNTGQHFFTISIDEIQNLVEHGWRVESTSEAVSVTSKVPVYRAYNPNNGDHHFTMNKDEIDHLVKVGWRYEGVSWYSASKKRRKPVYRLYNPNAKTGSHHLTSNLAERDYLVSLGWRAEGVAYYQVGD